jgi:hypothetical protein
MDQRTKPGAPSRHGPAALADFATHAVNGTIPRARGRLKVVPMASAPPPYAIVAPTTELVS